MEVLIVFLFIAIPIGVMYLCNEYNLSKKNIFILSIMPVFLVSIGIIIEELILGSIKLPNILRWFCFMNVMFYLILFFPLIIDSTSMIFLIKKYTLPFWKQIFFAIFISFFTMSIYLIFFHNFEYYRESIKILMFAIISGTLSVAILYYFTEFRKINT